MPPEFERFWAAYPRRVGRKKAVEAFSRAIKKTTLATMLGALAWQTKQPQWVKEQGAFIPYAQGWLNGERWDDEPFQAPPTRQQAPHVEHTSEWLALRDRMHGK